MAKGAAIAFLVGALAVGGCLSTPDSPLAPPPETYDLIRFQTDAGDFAVILYNQSAPATTARMQEYAQEGYFVGRSFGRIVPGHVIQVTDHAGGATEDTRRLPLEIAPGYHFSAGAMGIARGAEADSGGPQFFIMDFATSHLAGNFTVWGQVVEGLDVVHEIARGPAVDFRMLPEPLWPAAPTDQAALRPAVILATSTDRMTLPAGQWPMQVAENRRVGDLRHSLEWPKQLEAGRPAQFTWYVRPYNETPHPDPALTRVRVGDVDLSVRGDPTVEGIYHFSWTPPDLVPREATLVVAGRPLATLTIRP